jgi:hypothetical protein
MHSKYLVLSGVSDKPLSISEGDIAGRCPIALIVGNNLNLTNNVSNELTQAINYNYTGIQ